MPRSGVWGLAARPQPNFEQDNVAFLDNAEKTNNELKLFWMAVGEKDTLVGESAHSWTYC